MFGILMERYSNVLMLHFMGPFGLANYKMHFSECQTAKICVEVT